MTRGLASFWDELVAVGTDLDRLLELIARRAAEVVGEASVLTTVSADGETLEPVAVFHPDPDVRGFIRSVLASEPYRIGEGVAGAVAARREPAVVSGLGRDQFAAMSTPHTLRFLERFPIHSLVIVPMVAFGEVVGTLGAVRTDSHRPYDDEDVMVMEALAERAALALAEARRQPRRIGPEDYEAIFRHNVDGVLFTAPDGRILAANPAACDILRRTEAEICLLGRAGLLVDDRETRAAVAQRAVRGHVRADLRMRRGGGGVFTADVSSTIFTTADGELRASVIFRDVSEKAQAQAALARQHHHLSLLHTVTTAINEADDVDAAIQRTLDAVGSATGWPLGDAFLVSDEGVLRPTSAWRVADPARFGWFRRWMQPMALEADEGLAGRVVASATAVWESDLEAAALTREPAPPSPLCSYVGVPIMVGTSARGVLELFSEEHVPRDDGLLSVLVDLGTQLGRALERTEAEAAHRRLDDERAGFVARAAHELRSPVAALVLAVGVLARRGAPDARSRELLDVVVDSTDHLNRLVTRLLDLSRVEHGGVEVTLEPVELSKVVRRLLSMHPAPAARSVACHVPAGLRAVADELALGQVLTNLVVNAYRYGRGEVRIGAARHGDRVELWVSDDGPGVDPAIEPSLFAPFVRGADAAPEGVGLGLAISSRLVEAMGGSLRYERQDEGGCRFVLEVPAAA
ncbi:MAG TPA: ATP-binding protein [Acidimicrobiales bacterium]